MYRVYHRKTSGFTIVELLVVIVVIAILAAITIVSFTGISQKAVDSSLQSDLSNASKQLKVFQTINGAYPATNNCGIAESTTNICLKASSGTAFAYSTIVPSTFHLTATNGNNSYSVTDATSPAIATTANGSSVGSACPSGYIPVPGSGTYGTNDFCVMKYEAKNVGGVATSQAASTPWVSISQTTSITTAAAACTGCHLITEAEWLTIAQNVLNVPGNWSTGTVGSGYIYFGHNDNAPANALEASTNDSDGYYGTGNTTGSNQRRTLTLSNGEVIWDLAGNVWEWTSGTSTTGQPGIAGTGYAYRNYTTLTTHGTLSPDPFPAYTGITGASTWTSTNGIGQIYSNADETALRGFRRGGFWGHGSYAGVLGLRLDFSPGDASTYFGLRVSR